MRVTLWGTRGSLPSPGPQTARYGGNTSCVEVRGPRGTLLVLDAGTGIRLLGETLPRPLPRVDILLSHLHLDHIQGLGFFAPLHDEETEVHLWGPASTTRSLQERLRSYLSPPLFPIHLRDLPRARVALHELPPDEFSIGEFRVRATLVCHPGPTVGYRVSAGGATLAYLPDHEPALGARAFPLPGDWTSGYALAAGADLLIHDAQYADDEYASRVGWGHSAWSHALAFAGLAGTRHLVPFHHDPTRSDDELDRLAAGALAAGLDFPVTPAAEGTSYELDGAPPQAGRQEVRP